MSSAGHELRHAATAIVISIRCIAAALALTFAAPVAWSADSADETGCGVPVGKVTPICGLRAPEDLEVLPGSRNLLVSEFGGLAGGAGRLSALHLASRTVHPLYPQNALAGEQRWGDAACPGEPGANFSPHGIHLAMRADGRRRLLVVNHGGRESVEMFELHRTRHGFALAWRGCVMSHADEYLNDVASLPDGGFLVTVMMKRGDPEALRRGLRGDVTGYVLRWHPRNGWSRLPGSESSMPNGIQTDPRGRYAFLATPGTKQVWKIALPGGERLGAASTANPDNLAWTARGRLLTAGMDAGGEHLFELCRTGAEPECFAPSHVDEIDPETMRVTRLFAFGNREMHPATVGVRVGERLYVGSYAGDRLLEVALVR